MHLHTLCQAHQAIAAWLERIFPNCTPAVQAIFDYSQAMAKLAQSILEDARPTFVERQPLRVLGTIPQVSESE